MYLQPPGRKDSGRGESLDGSDNMLDESQNLNLATETKYSLVKNSIVKAETPVCDTEDTVEADIHARDDNEDPSDDEQETDKSSKSVKFNEENTFVAEVGNDDVVTEGAEEELETAGPVSARAVSTPASESSPRPSAAEQDQGTRVTSAKSEGTASVESVDGNTVGTCQLICHHYCSLT